MRTLRSEFEPNLEQPSDNGSLERVNRIQEGILLSAEFAARRQSLPERWHWSASGLWRDKVARLLAKRKTLFQSRERRLSPSPVRRISQRGGSGGSASRWQGGRINETAGRIDKDLDQRLRTTDKSAAHAQCLAQSSHLNVYLLRETECVDKARALRTDNSRGVCLIDKKHRSKFIFQINNRGEISTVSVHAENRIQWQ